VSEKRPKGFWIPLPESLRHRPNLINLMLLAQGLEFAAKGTWCPQLKEMADSARVVDLEAALPENFYKGLGPNIDAKSFKEGFDAARALLKEEVKP